MAYTHIEVTTVQSPKHPPDPCGDVSRVHRGRRGVEIYLADGLGHGLKAHLAAEMILGRLTGLVRGGFSLREAFGRVVQTMNDNRTNGLPYAAFSVARIGHDGRGVVLGYEAPPPLFVSHHIAAPLEGRTLTLEGSIVREVNCHLCPGDHLLLMSDGITQAGLGCAVGRRRAAKHPALSPEGWTAEGVCRFIDGLEDPEVSLMEAVHAEARRLWGRARGDDCTVVGLAARRGQVVQLLTGPPRRRAQDAAFVERFLRGEGRKIICGGSTANMAARHTRQRLSVDIASGDSLTPPRYQLAGIDLVTEGAVTLNQAYHLLEAGLEGEALEGDGGVFELVRALRAADRVDIHLGRTINLAGGDVSFIQQGILPRHTIIRLLRERLEADGKLVSIIDERSAG